MCSMFSTQICRTNRFLYVFGRKCSHMWELGKSHAFSTWCVCVRAHSRLYSGWCSRVSDSGGVGGVFCVSDPVLFLALFPSCSRWIELRCCVRSPSPANPLLLPRSSSNPQTAPRTQGHALKQPLRRQGQHAPALQGNGCYCCSSGTSGVKCRSTGL